MEVRIITDSASDLPKEWLRTYNIGFIPLRVYDNKSEYLDNVTLDPGTLFQNMREGTVYKTSLPAYESIYNMFSECAKEQMSCIYIAFSSELSGTYQTALLVREEIMEKYADFDLEIIDTKCASLGQGLIVMQAAEMAHNSAPKEDIVRHVCFLCERMEHIFTVGDLEYLVRGGRVSRLAGFIGGMLNIKPVLHMEDGKLIPLEKLRGRKKVLQRMIEIMKERGGDWSNQVIGISHGDDQEGANVLQDMITEALGCKTFVTNMIGAAIGAHAGPGTLAVFFLRET